MFFLSTMYIHPTYNKSNENNKNVVILLQYFSDSFLAYIDAEA